MLQTKRGKATLDDMKRSRHTSTLEAAASRYLSDHRGRAAIRPAPGIGRAATRVLKPLAKRFGVGVDQLTENWTEIAGERLAKWSSPEAIQRSMAGPVLIVRARGPAATVLQAEERRILERVKTYAGSGAPVRLKILQGAMRASVKPTRRTSALPLASPTTLPATASPDEKLEAALNRFDKVVTSKQGRGR